MSIIEGFLICTSAITLITTIVLFFSYLLKRERVYDGELPVVTIFLPFFNEDKDVLLQSLSYLDKQDYSSKLQIIVIDDGSDNNSAQYVEKWVSKKRNHIFELVKKPINDGRKGFALDYALELNIAIGEAYVVVDSDTYIEPTGIKELVSKLWSDNRYAAVCGYITPSNYADTFIGLLQHYEHISFYGAIRAAQDRLGCVPVLAGAFVAHRASTVKELGGWSEWLVEDIAWCWKAISNGYRTGYAPRAKATTQCPTDVKGLFKQRRRWSRGRVEAYMVAWNTHWFAGLCSTPWFVISATQYIFPSSLILISIMAIFNIWIPIIIGLINIFFYLILVNYYIKENNLSSDISKLQILKAPLFSVLLESITWLPNLLGYFDEFSGKKKSWLTR
ncbi:glycosyltransferase family 2 protein [Photobacterium leiognathi]|uniref:glycosyltransferase family 2 protein n=1 Tax=Photobacterium leiognathi TaxID=553611 RepID=UPI002980FD6E|nr:glycosyltransferase family 2 protein [Photobacterium leiognathi]